MAGNRIGRGDAFVRGRVSGMTPSPSPARDICVLTGPRGQWLVLRMVHPNARFTAGRARASDTTASPAGERARLR